MIHASDCAIYNAPALPVGPCDCGLALALRSENPRAAVEKWAEKHGFPLDGDAGNAMFADVETLISGQTEERRPMAIGAALFISER